MWHTINQVTTKLFFAVARKNGKTYRPCVMNTCACTAHTVLKRETISFCSGRHNPVCSSPMTVWYYGVCGGAEYARLRRAGGTERERTEQPTTARRCSVVAWIRMLSASTSILSAMACLLTVDSP